VQIIGKLCEYKSLSSTQSLHQVVWLEKRKCSVVIASRRSFTLVAKQSALNGTEIASGKNKNALATLAPYASAV